MVKGNDKIVDVAALVASQLSGTTRFANTKKVSRLGVAGYSDWLTGKLLEQASFQMNDPRRIKRAARVKSK